MAGLRVVPDVPISVNEDFVRCGDTTAHPEYGEIPCDRDKGHDGQHKWPRPMSFECWSWTDKRRKPVRDASR